MFSSEYGCNHLPKAKDSDAPLSVTLLIVSIFNGSDIFICVSFISKTSQTMSSPLDNFITWYDIILSFSYLYLYIS